MKHSNKNREEEKIPQKDEKLRDYIHCSPCSLWADRGEKQTLKEQRHHCWIIVLPTLPPVKVTWSAVFFSELHPLWWHCCVWGLVYLVCVCVGEGVNKARASVSVKGVFVLFPLEFVVVVEVGSRERTDWTNSRAPNGEYNHNREQQIAQYLQRRNVLNWLTLFFIPSFFSYKKTPQTKQSNG